MAPKGYLKREINRAKDILFNKPVDQVKEVAGNLAHDLDMARMQSGLDPTLIHSDLPEDETLAYLKKTRKGSGTERG